MHQRRAVVVDDRNPGLLNWMQGRLGVADPGVVVGDDAHAHAARLRRQHRRRQRRIVELVGGDVERLGHVREVGGEHLIDAAGIGRGVAAAGRRGEVDPPEAFLRAEALRDLDLGDATRCGRCRRRDDGCRRRDRSHRRGHGSRRRLGDAPRDQQHSDQNRAICVVGAHGCAPHLFVFLPLYAVERGSGGEVNFRFRRLDRQRHLQRCRAEDSQSSGQHQPAAIGGRRLRRRARAGSDRRALAVAAVRCAVGGGFPLLRSAAIRLIVGRVSCRCGSFRHTEQRRQRLHRAQRIAGTGGADLGGIRPVTEFLSPAPRSAAASRPPPARRTAPAVRRSDSSA